MALKFLNKKGWHTGSLRNIENVWKAEQKHDAEQKKLEELRKQIQEERERSEFRQLQEQAGLVPRQERLDFLYDSGLSVRKGSSSSAGGSGVAFQTLEESTPGANKTNDASSSSAAKQPSAPGALFEDKPHSANDAWRKLHSDPLLLIRQREQEALARIKNNPVQMAMIRKSAEAAKEGKSEKKKDRKKKHKHSSEKRHKDSPPEEQLHSKDDRADGEKRRDNTRHVRTKDDDRYHNARRDIDENSRERESQRRSSSHRGSSKRDLSPNRFSDSKGAKDYDRDTTWNNSEKSKRDRHSEDQRRDRKDREHISSTDRKEKGSTSSSAVRSYDSSVAVQNDSHFKRPKAAPRLSEEERAAKLKEMQEDAQLHEEQRWKRLKKAEQEDALEAKQASAPGGKNFLDAAQKSVFGAEKGGSSTIEESVRRRAYYSQGRSEAGDSHAFRR